MNNLFSDNMMLQRNSKVNIWGKSNPNKIVTVYSSWNNKSEKTKSNSNGDWILKIQTDSSVGPYELSISTSDDTKIIKNILFGEVWFASGQSNMEMPLDGFFGEPVFGAQDIIGKSINPQIRLITVERNYSSTPLLNFDGKWEESNPESSRYFSAVAYSFAKYLNQVLDIPFGIINSPKDGSVAEAWISPEVLKKITTEKELSYYAKQPHNSPSVLFNGMINAIIPFTIKEISAKRKYIKF